MARQQSDSPDDTDRARRRLDEFLRNRDPQPGSSHPEGAATSGSSPEDEDDDEAP